MGKLLSAIPKGSILKLGENGKATRFIKLDTDHYGAASGVTMLREKTFARIAYNAGYDNFNVYMGATLDNFCDGIFPLKLDPEIQACIVPVSIVVAEGNGVATLHTIKRKGFSLSCTEVGLSGWQTEGTLFDYFSDNNKRIAYLEDTTTAINWGLRSPGSDTDRGAYHVNTDGTLDSSHVRYPLFAPRPAFNLKSQIVVSDNPGSDGAYTVESVPVAGSEAGVYVKQNGVWVKEL